MRNEELEIKAKSGDGLSSYILGRNYYSSENGFTQDYVKSFDWYKFGYEKLNDPRCLYGYAMFYYDDGESESEGIVEKDNVLANNLFAKAYPELLKLSKFGDMYSTFILGAYHNYGIGGVEKSFDKALKFIEKAAELGHSGALYDMGKFYEIGKGLEQNTSKSIEYYTKSAKLGNERAKNKLTEIGKEKTYD